MAGLQQRFDTVKDSITSLFRRRRSISTPQNVKRVVHITFDPDNQTFSGIPPHWRCYFEESAEQEDSGIEQSPPQSRNRSASQTPREMLKLTFDNASGTFVQFPKHWQERLQRNELLKPEFQKNPQLLAAIFSMMDDELHKMNEEGLFAYELESDSQSSPCVTLRAMQLQ